MQTSFVEHQEKPKLSGDYVRMYYEHQYDRMAKLESQRLNVTNIVITISIVAFTFGFSNIQSLNLINGIGLPILVILANLFAIAYIKRSAGFIDVHQRRAIQVLETYAQDLFELNDSLPWPKRGRLGGRGTIQMWIHILMVMIAFLPIGVYTRQVILRAFSTWQFAGADSRTQWTF